MSITNKVMQITWSTAKVALTLKENNVI